MKKPGEEKTYLTFATKIILTLLLLFFLWAACAPLNSSVIANGEIILTTDKKTISHLAGGIITKIQVSEGELVKSGQELITLDTVQTSAKIKQIEEEVRAAQYHKLAITKRLETLKSELAVVTELLSASNSSLTRKLDLQKQLDETEGKFGELTASIASLQSEYQAAKDILEKSVIKAPVAGAIMGLKYQTIGGVIPQASDIMFIVPKDDHLIVEVKIRPSDIDLLSPGMVAKVQLSAYKTRLMPKLEGRLKNISGDSFKNEMNSQVYFKARLEIPDSELKKLKSDIKLTPGMPVTAFIITGSRTLLQYLLAPLQESAYKAFREE